MTDLEVVRLLIRDQDAPQNFTDEELQAFLDLNGGSVYLACALATDNLALESESTSATSITIGSYSESSKGGLSSFQSTADRFRQLEFDTPAFAVAQEAFTDEGQLRLILDFVSRGGE